MPAVVTCSNVDSSCCESGSSETVSSTPDHDELLFDILSPEPGLEFAQSTRTDSLVKGGCYETNDDDGARDDGVAGGIDIANGSGASVERKCGEG